jgi:hypothetical protein
VTIAIIKPALYVACRDCRKDCLAGDLRDRRCLNCRIHLACAGVRAEISAFFKKQQRYAAAGAIANDTQLSRLQRRLMARVIAEAPDPRKAPELADAEWRLALKDTPIKRFSVDREEAVQLHPDVGRLQILRA